MHKKLVAALTIAIFILSTLAVVTPAKAAFTLGYQTSSYPYRANDYFPHLTDVIGYVWPGGGQDWYTGSWGHPTGSIAGFPMASPGYQSPYPNGNPPGAPSQSWYQLDGHTYTPFGAVLAGSSGDLIFGINASAQWPGRGAKGYDRWYILIPPEFTLPDKSQITTTLRNDYARISTFHLGYDDLFAPGWNVVYVWSNGIAYDPIGHNNHGFLNFTTTQDNWYYVRVNGVKAPTIAGRYFFKMWLHGAESDNGGDTASHWMPAPNWPVMLVKGEVDPAIITGNIRYGPYNASLAGQPILESGKVWAHMKTKLDPYTGASVADCTASPAPAGCTDAVGYFNNTAHGHYEVEGVAPGIYDIYASAMGYPQTVIASNVQILKGQSLHLDGYLNPGVVIHGTVDSKHQFGTQPFPRTDYIKIELYNQPTGGHWPTTNPITWSPLPCTANAVQTWPEAIGNGSPCVTSVGQLQYAIEAPWHENFRDYHALQTGQSLFDWAGVGPAQTWQVISGGTRFYYQMGVKGEYGTPTAFDGHVPQINATWVDGLQPGRYYVRAWLTQYVQTTLDGATFNEVGFNVAANEWAGDVTVPIDLRLGDVVNKTIHFHDTPGTFTASPIDTGASYLDAQLVDSAGNVWANNQTVWSGTAPDGRIAVCQYYGPGCDATLPNYGAWQVSHGMSYVVLMGFNNRTDGRDYGIPAGTYGVNEYILGYVQQTVPQVSVSLSGTYLNFSDNVYRGLGFNLTVYSIDFERPRVDRNWVYPYNPHNCGVAGWDGGCVGPDNIAIDILILDSKGNVADSITNTLFQDPSTNHFELSQNQGGLTLGLCNSPSLGMLLNSCNVYFGAQAAHGGEGGYASATAAYFLIGDDPSWSYFGPMGAFTAFESGTYSFRGWTLGYVQNKDFTVSGLKGDIADIKINLLKGVNISLTIPFKKEGLLTPTSGNMSARVRVFDDSGMMVGTWYSDLGVSVTASYNATGTVNSPVYAAVGHDGSLAYPWQWNGFNFVPGGVSSLKVPIAGIGTWYGYYQGDANYDPVYHSMESDLAWPTFKNGGIFGAPDYTGGYTAEVDFVPWYRNNTFSAGPPGGYTFANFYPPVNGLLMGESYHFIPGADYAANGGFGYTGVEDAANHLGPYAQQGQWLLPNAYLGGETSGVFEVDLRGYVAGNLNGFTWSNELRTLSWSTPGLKYNVQFASSDGHTYSTYAQDGIYESFLPDGTYALTVSAPGMTTITGTVSVTAGQAIGGFNFNMEQSGIPIPEFSGIAIVAFSALAASLYLLRRRRR